MKSKFRLLALLLLPLLLVLITGADHRDAPGVLNDPASDINDVYIFKNANTGNIVLAMTVNPFTAPGLKPTFSPNTLYQFKIDNNNDAVEDLVVQVTFSPPNVDAPNTAANPGQTFTVRGPAKPAKTGVVNTLLKTSSTITGPINNAGTNVYTTDASTGIRVFAGVRDDPFFLDFIPVIAFINNPTATGPGSPVAALNPPRSNVDFFGGFNVSIIAIELPAAMLHPDSSNHVRFYGTTSVLAEHKRSIKSVAKPKNDTQMPVVTDGGSPTYEQFDRMGLPLYATALVANEHKDAFNASIPSNDGTLFIQDVIMHLLGQNGGDTAAANTLAQTLMVDMLTMDVTSTNGFALGVTPSLNGRRPEDDTVDVALTLTTMNSQGVSRVTGDGVPANDVPFLTDFPFFAAPHLPAAPIPARN